MTNPETLLAANGFYASVVHGHSMEPFLRDHHDTVYIETADGYREMDVVLFRRNGRLVLHRILKQCGDRFIVCGDNEFCRETVKREQILGVMTAFTRGKRTVSVTSRGYRLLSRMWTLSFPTKRLLRRMYLIGRRRT